MNDSVLALIAESLTSRNSATIMEAVVEAARRDAASRGENTRSPRARGRATLATLAHARGMHTMRRDAQRWIDSGATALEEVLRVTRD